MILRKSFLAFLLTCACNFLQAQVNIIKTIAGNGVVGYCCDDGPATDANLYAPTALCLDYSNNLYFADAGNSRIRKISFPDLTITTIVGTDSAGYNGDNIAATNARLYVPDGIFADSSGNIYIADGLNQRIRKVTKATGIITTICGTGATGSTGDGGLAINAELNIPAGICLDKQNNIYIADYLTNKIRKIDAITGIISAYAGNGIIGYTGDGGPATNAKFNGPVQPIADTFGNIFICDQNNNTVRKVDAITGIVNTIAGTGTAGYTGDGGLAIYAKLNQPAGIYVDMQGNIFIAEFGNGVIRRVDGTSGIISTVAGNGTLGFSGDGGPATAAELKCSDVFLDKNGVIYIADQNNDRVRMVYNTAMGIGNVQMGQYTNVKIYPNPVNDELNIENGANSDLIIYNLLGSELLETKLISNKEAVNIINLTPGVYLVKIIGANGEVQNFRVVKE